MLLTGFRSRLLALLGVLLASAIFGAKGPLQDIHWDAPIYLQRARAFAETPYLRDFSNSATKIAEDLRSFRVDAGETTPYWSFIRLGHIVVLGSVITVLGPGERAIHAAFWIYILILVAAVALAAHAAVGLMNLFRVKAARGAVVAGAATSAGLYLASDVCRHLAGNFVAEVPAMFLLAVGIATLVAGLRSGSVVLGAASGVAAFLMYVCKADAIWVYLSFLIVVGIALFAGTGDRSRLKAIAAGAVTAAVAYLAYAFVFWPLPDPRLILVFERAHDEIARNSISPMKLWVVAGGLLWFGVAIAALLAPRERLTQVGFAWLLAVLLPYLPSALEARPMQVRMFALLMPAFLLLSSVGWASLLQAVLERRIGSAPRWILGAGLLLAVVLSHQETYAFMRQFPGGWRLQFVRAWLSPPNYERLSYPLADLKALTEYLYADSAPKVLILDKPKNAELFSFVEFLRPPETQGLRTGEAVANAKLCGAAHDFSRRQVTSCLGRPSPEEVANLAGDVGLLYLQRTDEPDSPDDSAAREALFRSGPLVVRAWRLDGDHSYPEARR